MTTNDAPWDTGPADWLQRLTPSEQGIMDRALRRSVRVIGKGVPVSSGASDIVGRLRALADDLATEAQRTAEMLVDEIKPDPQEALMRQAADLIEKLERHRVFHIKVCELVAHERDKLRGGD